MRRPVAEYLQQKIWQPIGAEADATWLVDRSGQEETYCCLNAVLRDYARLGRLLADDGTGAAGSSSPPPGSGTPRSRTWTSRTSWAGTAMPFFGYGYQTYLARAARRFAFHGNRGQPIFVDPQSRLVMIQTAVRNQDAQSGW